jgi:hypothetical protein
MEKAEGWGGRDDLAVSVTATGEAGSFEKVRTDAPTRVSCAPRRRGRLRVRRRSGAHPGAAWPLAAS